MTTDEVEEHQSVFREWCDVTTAHGFIDFSRAKTILGKVIWFLLIFISLVLMCNQLFRVISDYSVHQWATSVQKTPPDYAMNFPSIIICNVNRLKQSRANATGMTIPMIRYMFLNLILLNGYFATDVDFTAEQDFINWRKARNLSFVDIWNAVAPKCEDIFVEGVCNQFQVFPTETVEYGRCYRVELNRTSYVVGAKGAVTLMLNVQSWDYLPLFVNNFLLEGMVLQLNYNGKVELGNWITLFPGSRTSVGMQVQESTVRERQRSIINPFDLIVNEPPCAYQPQLQYLENSQYSINTCGMECNWMVMVQHCNCLPYFRYNNFRTCEVEEMIKCAGLDRNLTSMYDTLQLMMFSLEREAVFRKSGIRFPFFHSQPFFALGDLGRDIPYSPYPFMSGAWISLPDVVQNTTCRIVCRTVSANRSSVTPVEKEAVFACYLSCKQPCFGKMILTQTNVGKFPSDQQLPELQAWLLEKNLTNVQTKDIIMLEIYFNSLETVTLELYQVMNLEDFVSSCGGLIGLWAGMSFLTIFQAIAFFLKYLEECRKERPKLCTNCCVHPSHPPNSIIYE